MLSWRSLTKIAGSESGSVSQRYGSVSVQECRGSPKLAIIYLVFNPRTMTMTMTMTTTKMPTEASAVAIPTAAAWEAACRPTDPSRPAVAFSPRSAVVRTVCGRRLVPRGKAAAVPPQPTAVVRMVWRRCEEREAEAAAVWQQSSAAVRCVDNDDLARFQIRIVWSQDPDLEKSHSFGPWSGIKPSGWKKIAHAHNQN